MSTSGSHTTLVFKLGVCIKCHKHILFLISGSVWLPALATASCVGLILFHLLHSTYCTKTVTSLQIKNTPVSKKKKKTYSCAVGERWQ